MKSPKAPKLPSYGGQALLEGVMMRGAAGVALAVRSPEGDILLEVKRQKRVKRWYNKTPVLRGIAAFGDSLITGVKMLTKSAEVCAPEEEKLGKGWMGFAIFMGLALGVGLFIILPMVLNSLVIDLLLPQNILLSSLVEGGLRIGIFILYLFAVSLMKDIRRTFMYHGAEHRTINCFEKGMELTVENVQKCSTRHNRCGTTFLFFVMLLAILVFSLTNWIIASLGITPESAGGFGFIMIKLAIRLSFLPFVAGLSYELLKLLASLPDNWFTAIFRAPGLALQRLTTYPPDDGMAEVALASFLAVRAMDADPNLPELAFGQFYYKTYRAGVEQKLAAAGADGAEADWIFCDATGLKRSELRTVSILTFAQHKGIKRIIERRQEGEPLWYILGYCDFYGIRMAVNHNALIPRPETEILCEQAIKAVDGAWCAAHGKKEPGFSEQRAADGGQLLDSDYHLSTPAQSSTFPSAIHPPPSTTHPPPSAIHPPPSAILDLCTGSGCIALALAKNTAARITASDISTQALSLAANNLEGTGVELVLSDLFENLKERAFDVIVSNPPYIASGGLENLATEIKNYEPLIALDGGADGLDFYRRIIKAAPAHLNNGGSLLLEAGYNQAAEIKSLLYEAGFTDIKAVKDLNGVERVVRAVKSN